jgi:hypothetical protein
MSKRTASDSNGGDIPEKRVHLSSSNDEEGKFRNKNVHPPDTPTQADIHNFMLVENDTLQQLLKFIEEEMESKENFKIVEKEVERMETVPSGCSTTSMHSEPCCNTLYISTS